MGYAQKVPQYKRDGFDLNALYPTQEEPTRSAPPLAIVPKRERPRQASVNRKATPATSPAWTAAKLVLALIGFVSTVAIVTTLPYWLIAIDGSSAVLTWYGAYRLLRWMK
jgi:hypothetical protein